MNAPDPESMHLDLGRTWLSRGRPDQAEDELRKALALDPDNGEAQALLGMAVLYLGKNEEALELGQGASGAEPDWFLPRLVISGAYLQLGKYGKAETAAREALQLDPEEAGAYSALSAALAGRKVWRESLEAAEAGLELDPEHTACANHRAFALIQLGEAQEAELALGASLRHDPEDPNTHAHLGWQALSTGNSEEAIRHYREALRLDPDSDWARAGLVEAMNSRNIVYRLFLKWFLFTTRIPARKMVLFLIALVVGRQVLMRLAEATPSIAPVLMAIVWASVVFALMTFIAQPLFNLLLRADRDGRHALRPLQITQTNWLLGCLIIAASLGASWLAGGVGMGLATGLWGAASLPIVLAAGTTGRLQKIRAGFAVALVLMGVALTFGERSLAPQRQQLTPYFERLSKEALADETLLETEVSTWSVEDQRDFATALEKFQEHLPSAQRHKTLFQGFLYTFVAFTWVGGIGG